MELNERNIKILTLIITFPETTSKEVQKKFNLTRNQINYSITKINNWLQFEGHQPIVRTRQGKFIVSNNLVAATKFSEETNKHVYEYSESDRISILLLILISSTEDLSLFHFSYELGVSKNTILRDFKEVKTIIRHYYLTLEYDRINGYALKGREWNIRNLLEQIVTQIYYHVIDGPRVIKHFCKIKDKNIDVLGDKLAKIEDKLNVKYAEHKLWVAPYILYIIIRRIKMGDYVGDKFNISFNELSDTKEYFVINELLSGKINVVLPNEEKLYLTLFLLTLNVLEINPNYNSNELEQKIDQLLNIFENNYVIHLNNKKDLRKKLFIHLSSAIYRIKYHLSLEYPAFPVISKEYAGLIDLVKGALKPLEDFVGVPFPEQEVDFIAILIGGSIESVSEKKNNKELILNAVVVCPNGVMFSNIIQGQLKELLPYVKFNEPLSIREFNSLTETAQKYDLIFSSVPLNSPENIIVLSTFFDEFEKSRITNLVSQRLRSVDDPSLIARVFMGIVSRHVSLSVNQKYEIVSEFIESLEAPDKDMDDSPSKNIELLDLLDLDFVQVTNETLDWTSAIVTASQPLLDRSYISGSYVDSISEKFPEIYPSITLGKHTTIPHSMVEDGSYKTGMSFLKLKEPIKSSIGEEIFFVIVVSTTFRKDHIKAMNQLLKIVTDTVQVKKLIESKTKEEVYQVFNEFKVKEGST